MKISLHDETQISRAHLVFLGAFAKGKEVQFFKWPSSLKKAFFATPGAGEFLGEKDTFTFYHEGCAYQVLGLGDKKKFKNEDLRKAVATAYKKVKGKYKTIGIHLGSLGRDDLESTISLVAETVFMADYHFDKYISQKQDGQTKEVILISISRSSHAKKALEDAQKIASSINIIRDFINAPPNVLRSPVYAKEIVKDVRTHLKGCKVRAKILGKKELKSEKMRLFLSVNAGSAFEPQLVHLTYTPKKMSKKTKHVVLVGKGLVFDTGGYSLKGAPHMMNMKYDMAGSATMYGAFRAAALLGLETKVTCLLGMTDNAVNALATMPDSIVKGRNGKTVEILNTDAEGRLVLADCLDYACDQNPDFLVDAATLTGACLVALGREICALMSNDPSLAERLIQSAKRQG